MISFDRYIDIVSGVGAGAAVAERELILRIITNNSAIPPGIVAEFSNADAVMAYFGASSVEYLRAAQYFGFVSKSIRSPAKISFSRWIDAAIAPMVVGDSDSKAVSTFTGITAGSISFTVNGTVVSVGPINLAAAGTLTSVAAALQSAIRTSTNTQLVGASVTFNTNTNQFILTGSVTGTGVIKVATGTLADALGWSTSGTVFVGGQAAVDAVAAASSSAALSTNFGSFLFLPRLDYSTSAGRTIIGNVAAWNHSQNNKYMFLQGSTIGYVDDVYGVCEGYSGMGVTVLDLSVSDDYAEQCPAEILASTDYDSVNGVQSYMYYQFGSRNTTVSDDTTADTCDKYRANYIGVTETAGQAIAFYQRGVLFGDSTAAVDMNTYANEMWLKDHIAVAFMTLFLNSPHVPANKDGRATLLSILQTAVGDAKSNGVISAGKTLTNAQKQYIISTTGNANAWRQVQDDGAYFDIAFKSSATTDGRTEYSAVYTLVYSKDDSVRKVTGTNTLI